MDIEHIDDKRTGEEAYSATGGHLLRAEDHLLTEDDDPLLVDKDRLADDEGNGALDSLRDPKRK
ncbi:hypothetical protein JZM24_12810 [Candidatus Sodalis endolongispinus]|uniref:Uncharacterized protein n=1 Tax=Candidatus Sodalis endolongispinus TaxID=2812662 RepID=A0ABS5YFF8_9GAMM|nr:hypothetical protein [Candidatus Sodalis endolongispinus]MBT9432791.1 hypothetical protein [Candidatus Sodalis endolongispinus]